MLTAEKTNVLTWKTHQACALTAENLGALFCNEIPLIRVKNFASAAESQALIERANRRGFSLYEQVVPPIERIGVTVFEFDKGCRAAYFEKAREVLKLQREIFGESFSPLHRVIEACQAISEQPVGVASSPEYGSYYAGLVRRIEAGTELHIDFAPAEHDQWEVAQVAAQLAWNIYLELDVGCGQTTVYNRAWRPEDDSYKNPGGYGYLEAVLSGEPEFVQFSPKAGDLYIFNTQNYHLVEPSRGRRTTASSAMGRLPSGEILFWS